MRIHYNDLPRTIRERVASLFASTRVPRALLVEARPRGRTRLVLASALMLFGLAFFALMAVGSARSQAPSSSTELYATMGILAYAFLASVATLVLRSLWKPPPFLAGSFLFPSYAVAAEGEHLDILRLDWLQMPKVTHVHWNGMYVRTTIELVPLVGEGRAVFVVRSHAKADAVVRAILDAKARIESLIVARDEKTLMQIDPFYECTLSGEWREPPDVPKIAPLIEKMPRKASLIRWLAPIPVAIVLILGFRAMMTEVCRETARATSSNLACE